MSADVKRQFFFLTLDDSPKDSTKLQELLATIAKMESTYSKGRVCNKTRCYVLNPDLYSIIGKSRNYDELVFAWKGWRDSVGRNVKRDYMKYVEISNIGATDNNYADEGAYWRVQYELPDEQFFAELEKLWTQMKPFYEQLHGYIRGKLRQKYGKDKISEDGPIPAHLLGNMWAQSWENLYDMVVPYPNQPIVDVTSEMVRQNYTVLKMFELSEEFFLSIGMKKLPEIFWRNSIIEKRKDVAMTCHASAWDLSIDYDVRVKMCTNINQGDLITVHHELGHIQYYLQYWDQPSVYRRGANPGFHEAVGDTLALSVVTPKHLQNIGLLKQVSSSNEADINYLLSQALDKIAFIPFGYLMDQWRWKVFSGEIIPTDYNYNWWELRNKYQGIVPPELRSEIDFDPGAKYHIPASVPYIRYFVSYILQFQFQRSLCQAANKTNEPLYLCSIYQSQEAGEKLSEMLSLGRSKPWPEVLKALTGGTGMDATAIIDYFKPLNDWLTKYNKDNNFKVGWAGNGTVKQQAIKFVMWYQHEAEKIYHKNTWYQWNYSTNLTSHNAKLSAESSINTTAAIVALRRKGHSLQNVSINSEIDRQLRIATFIPASAGSPESEELVGVNNEMDRLYSTGKACNGTTCYSLNPGLDGILAKSRDYNELLFAWHGWRNGTGPSIKPYYIKYVSLMNTLAKQANYSDAGARWRSRYGNNSKAFTDNVQKLWLQLKPFYQNLHAYVRKRLREKYGADKVSRTGPVPAHLFGNMWAQSWINIYDMLVPYPKKQILDVTDEMVKQNYTVKKIFEVADEFFVSMGLERVPKSFWKNSMLEKPKDRQAICHASAWDFYRGDVRFKMCTQINFDDFLTVHHEMGHIQYYLQYGFQPLNYRSGANPAFHEAVGDTISLSVTTPDHLRKVGLLKSSENDQESAINYLMLQALDKIAFLPFGYLVDQWRWKVFDGSITPENYNKAWWELRTKYQGIIPPVSRTEEDFDPGAKYHIPGSTPYIRYFISYIIQFQFQKALCQAAGNTQPLYLCSVYQSKEAGKRLGDMLKLGRSKSWEDAMEAITGQREMDASAIVEYFKPLDDWLKEQNKDEVIGWDTTTTKPQVTTPSTGSAGRAFTWSTLFIALFTCLIAFDLRW
ncbi:uncharacterized protein TRIADDRAFT_37492 [Trichoplax adhaerens]|uniref:Angiotensin-converting enzyme n=1 Tax=Trichoplax adhaerens TaxID=10228 RepID=B3RUA8_TRIAD|nr:hypothetical protein TRIADDRAFT_37492 [Trichoplax adhaerens]EDV25300.1 hypothetical protein TRIADDRAFT_37492 [Trichoplax adhaerens]|eukprot:XP_002111333.1 hypothetical protein TRIADDRAFT_37492 [Trichoplax adhaerens]